jgi:predicted P-loop ATPase
MWNRLRMAWAALVRGEGAGRDPWEEQIASFLRGRDEVGVEEVLRECLAIKRRTQAERRRVMAVLLRLGWQRGVRVYETTLRVVYRAPVVAG